MDASLLMPLSEMLTSHDYILSERSIAKRTYFPPHWHDYFELEIVLSGTGLHQFNGKSYILAPGCAYLMSYYDFHSFTALDDVRLMNLRFREPAVDDPLRSMILMKKGAFSCQFSPQEQIDLQKLVHKIQMEDSENLLFRQSIIRNIIFEMVVMLVRKTPLPECQQTPGIIQQAIAYLHAHFTNSFSLDALAGKLAISPNYLGHLFKEETGMNFHHYLNVLRLKYACSLLKNSTLSTKEIAFASGYRSHEYFIYVFKKYACRTPGEYRKANASVSPD